MFTNKKSIEALANKNRVQWELIKKIKSKNKKASTEDLIHLSASKLAKILAKL